MNYYLKTSAFNSAVSQHRQTSLMGEHGLAGETGPNPTPEETWPQGKRGCLSAHQLPRGVAREIPSALVTLTWDLPPCA